MAKKRKLEKEEEGREDKEMDEKEMEGIFGGGDSDSSLLPDPLTGEIENLSDDSLMK